jgi:hypothetical protein
MRDTMKMNDRVCLKYLKDKRGTIIHISKNTPKTLYTIRWDHGTVSILDNEFIELVAT